MELFTKSPGLWHNLFGSSEPKMRSMKTSWKGSSHLRKFLATHRFAQTWCVCGQLFSNCLQSCVRENNEKFLQPPGQQIPSRCDEFWASIPEIWGALKSTFPRFLFWDPTTTIGDFRRFQVSKKGWILHKMRNSSSLQSKNVFGCGAPN